MEISIPGKTVFILRQDLGHFECFPELHSLSSTLCAEIRDDWISKPNNMAERDSMKFEISMMYFGRTSQTASVP